MDNMRRRSNLISKSTVPKIFFIFFLGTTIMWTWTSEWCDDPFSDSWFCDAYHESDYHRAVVPEENVRRSSECPRRLLVARTVPYTNSDLGNHVMEYASAFVMGKKHNMSVVVSDVIASVVRELFERPSLMSEDAFVEALLRKDMGCARRTRWRLRDAPEADSAPEVENLIQQQEKQSSDGKVTVALRSNIVLAEAVAGALELLRPELRLQRTLEAQVQRTMLGEALSAAFPALPEGEIVYVGVHVRRNNTLEDKTSFFENEETGEIGVDYFIRAMDFMLQLLEGPDGDDGRGGNSRVLFLVVSNTQRWCREILIPKLSAHAQTLSAAREIRGTGSSVSVTVLWAGSGDRNRDFALLASCNHSIISYGTFGTAAALLAGGRTVVFDISAGMGHKRNGAMRFADYLTYWTIMV